ncbi:AAA family ATPase [Rhodobacteraceae bacterium N5(2021)]|nr:Wzz/FepE/Etk N-terminal domain-containing protein [Gymnodinialimonas phycosphaerae]MBY4891250.1 AAA family ATPase [Gymnodinialimonas phycosphaerae]
MTRAAEATSNQASDEIDLMALLGVLWRGKLWIMLVAAIFGALAIFYGTRVAVPMYPARVTLAMDAQQQQVIGDIESIFGGGDVSPFTMNTEFEILRSRTLIGRLVDEMNLTEDPEFNPFLAEPGLLTRLRMSWTDWEPTPPDPDRLRNRVIDRVIGRLSISNIRLSMAFNVEITTTDPTKSMDMVNTLAEIYIDNQIRRKLDQAQRAIQFLSERTTELEASVEALEQDLARRMEESDVIDAELLQAQNIQLRDLRSRVEDAQVRLAEDRSLQVAIAEADDFEALVTLLEGTRDTRFIGIIQRYRAGRLGEEATRVALEGIADDLENDIRRTQIQLASLQASADELSSQLALQSDELIAIQQLEREVEASRLLYETFLTRLQEASIQQGLETADSSVLSAAVPRGRSSPRIVRLTAVALFLGGVIGAAIAMFREWRFAGFRTTDEVRSITGSSVLGALPSMAVRGRKEVLKYLKDKPNSVFAESVRNLRTSILMVNPDKEPQVILVTSSIPGEGKTTMSLSLARYMGSLEGRRVLLLEADIRRQTLRAYVDDERPEGVKLLDVLLGKARLENADLFDADLGVEVLMGSGGEYNAADLFESRRFGDLITRLRDTYDHIIIDSPPVLAVPDARVLTRYADATIFAIRWGHTSRTQVRQGLDMLDSVGHPADGTVLTQVDQRKMKSYGYGGQYGYDGYSSGYYAKD